MNIKKFIRDPLRIIYAIGINGYLPFIPDEPYLKMMFRCFKKKKLDLKNPQTYDEKLQWLKLHYRRAELTELVDKAAAKEYVSHKIGNQYVIPTIAIGGGY